MDRRLELELASNGPLRTAKRSVVAGGITWNVIVDGQGPVILLLHGTGSSSHSWSRAIPLLREHFTLVAPDLPGHALTTSPRLAEITLPGMAAAIAALMKRLSFEPSVVVGHSAGAAIGTRAVLSSLLNPKVIVSFNGALLPLAGFAGGFFSPLAKLLAMQPWIPRIMSWRAKNTEAVRSLLVNMGSHLRPEDVAHYARLFQNKDHVAATLAMMANWDLKPLQDDLARLSCPLILVTAALDKAIPPSDAERISHLTPFAQIVALPALGHLAHEERPDIAADIIARAAADGFSVQHRATASDCKNSGN